MSNLDSWSPYFNVLDSLDDYDDEVADPFNMCIDETYQDIHRINDFCAGVLFDEK